ncbi:dimethylamine monooxygenase subunit DmmA family protein [Acinetobacter baumannii]|uniref:Dimethylamine monooxygenase subunit DmmA-like C-terminal domain-containing protein n=1 Tax=Acinetobacter baumannii TaxID=470 RepID=A0A505MTK7_ACIBA|nr:dimethylamine monooxygenase subunit DmmA family protein [Acinetobacter baumannii]EJB8497451.1 hypothetical protein [Acinetobacter baumannii]ELB0341910.1 hypothetical protein [Acinetobacter baumannii]KCY24650.1 hypothetical protein J635_0062 [Acinetobacter baumannii 233846]MCJ8816212.1 hypothetical protein [Acinetobacter baumannii]MCJ8987340.1 hypothetical protein [Acinetobacter baumannii]
MQEHMLSTPVYQNLHDLQIQHGKTIFLVQSSLAMAAQNLQQKMQDADMENFFLFQDSAIWAEQLHTRITQRLNQLQAGWHAVICGDEYFIWVADAALRQVGFLKDEMARVFMTGKRQVYCVHCFHMQSSTAEDFCQCENCGVDLLIRTHFSERLGAYMGVCANAESLGKPDAKEVCHV